jgi:hypothetical protein
MNKVRLVRNIGIVVTGLLLFIQHNMPHLIEPKYVSKAIVFVIVAPFWLNTITGKPLFDVNGSEYKATQAERTMINIISAFMIGLIFFVW